MTVVHLTRDYPPPVVGGISSAVAAMTGGLVARGTRCAVVSFDRWRARRRPGNAPGSPPVEATVDGVAVLRVSSPDHLRGVEAFCHTRGARVAHVHHAALWPIAERLAVPAVLSIHVAQDEQNRLRGIADTHSARAQRAALAAADGIVAPTRAAARACGVDRDPRARVIPLGVPAPQRTRDVARAGAGPLLYAGRFADINGTAELFAAMPRILAAAPAWRAVVAGGLPLNPKRDRRWRRRWREAAPPSIAARVELAGWLAPAALAERYASAAMLVSPSWFETFGLVVAEAMAAGVPVIAARAGGVAELVDHERTGLLVPPRDVDALVAAVARLRGDPALAARLGAAAAADVGERFGVDRCVADLAAIYASLVSDSNAS